MTAGRRWLLRAGLAYVAILLAVVAGLAHLHDSSRHMLDEALGQRLLGLARGVATLCDGEAVALATLDDDNAGLYLQELSAICAALVEAESLAEITLTDAETGIVLMTTSPALRVGEVDAFLDLDPAAVAAARGGLAAAGPLYRGPAGGAFQKSAHAPVFNYSSEGAYQVGVLTVSGSPDFFVALERLRRAAGLTVAVVVAVLTVLGLALQRIVAALDRAREAALRQENLASIGRMTAGIAHEIRNPLGIIRGAGQHLERVLGEAGITDEVAAFIPEEVDRLDRILTGYLALGTGQVGPAEEFDLVACLRRGARLLAAELGAAGVVVDGPAESAPLVVSGDPRRLQQVLLNLLLNARDAMPGGGRVTVTVAVAAAPGASSATVTVADEGTGLGALDPGRLFEPFRTTKEKGSGLGLAISRRIVEDMGGTLDLRGRRDRRGAEAVLSLPLAGTRKG
jgi:signal transduction histidine kinase